MRESYLDSGVNTTGEQKDFVIGEILGGVDLTRGSSLVSIGDECVDVWIAHCLRHAHIYR